MRCLPLAILALTSALTAQTVGMSLTALTPLTVQVSNGPTNNSSTLPAGPMTSAGGIYTAINSGGLGAAATAWSFGTTNRIASATITHDVGNLAQVPTFVGRAGQDEYLVTFTSAVPRSVYLDLNRDVSMSAGAAASLAQIDLHNDGVINIANVSPVGFSPQLLTFGPQPLLVRIIMDTPLGPHMSSFQRLTLSVTPANNLVVTTPVTTCMPGVPQPPPFLAPSFQDRGVDMFINQNLLAPFLVVLSLNPQPALLAMNGSYPCITLPSPDVVLMPQTGSFTLGLPAAVRPATVYAQGVWLMPLGLRTTDGYSVIAN